ncbi:hypothetical protein PROFUN_05966 [Planoprotostelium fungivorum]|uniref:Thioredoxin-like fold domain-containing protein n=1 Tax=Planoprotostelium fungivorum TaxID=1890364 RepID=A0A2P6NP89_9EUKA|nr:hypothetical protein PROFUN_05966 [Planoprotostelium fungivorum]
MRPSTLLQLFLLAVLLLASGTTAEKEIDCGIRMSCQNEERTKSKTQQNTNTNKSNMALAARLSGHRRGAATAPHTLEVFLDYVCPFSAKIYKKLNDEVLPFLDKEHPGKVSFIFRQQVQPWHPISTEVNEAGLAIERLAPNKFFEFSTLLFEHQKDYFDENVADKSRNDTYRSLSALAEKVGVDRQQFLDLLIIPTGPNVEVKNGGNKLQNDLKLVIRAGRQNGIHVSPTVLWDGIADTSVSSGWDLAQWKEWLDGRFSATGRPSL